MLLGALGGFFLSIFSKKIGPLSKSADPRFLHTVHRFGLVFKVLGFPKFRKNVNKGVLEMIVF